MDMTLAQLEGFELAAARLEKDRLLQIALAFRAAESTDKGWDAFVGLMREEP